MIEPTTEDNTLISEALEILQTEGFDGAGKAVELLMNTVMRIEREQYNIGRFWAPLNHMGWALDGRPYWRIEKFTEMNLLYLLP